MWQSIFSFFANWLKRRDLDAKVLWDVIDRLDSRLKSCEERWAVFEKTRQFIESQDIAHSNAIVTVSERGQIMEWNEAATKMFGWEKDQAIGQNITLITPPRFRQKHLAAFREAVGQKKNWSLAFSISSASIKAATNSKCSPNFPLGKTPKASCVSPRR